ncbi:DUF2442 domain-containing protein [Geomonas sp. Red32]|uniref:DUF2442 domain-containing protein n=1 Tax=Geomonas sp. Red32 TaxID=2912856 RepID=UPI00202CAF7E|nr:DUF2442 domain-containing protein [Geomonas sp. Red32]MCM0083036.1 DUF2442 domain-containing protein [Geomonas sp. Red32]
MSKAPLIQSVQVADNQRLVIGWNTGETLDCDLADVISRHTALAPLAAAGVFSQVTVEEWGHGLDWPEGLDMGAERLYQLCREQAGLLSPAGFDEWMKKNRLSLTTAADALGMTRRMIAHYRSGSKPIPKTVQLACIGWDALNNAA